ncbi:hypothetical protein B0T16DRAFT_511291 [Cercophora newfieldiana]|uniref:Uncharacterized protein n=1 Tax=Cercophora newfieldiana TaxID=92897 RepID=A0AA40CQD5_9PEZI|nr:hypothetical protein B0T16DRAFT_511291 [Cercophora newfieldiana]
MMSSLPCQIHHFALSQPLSNNPPPPIPNLNTHHAHQNLHPRTQLHLPPQHLHLPRLHHPRPLRPNQTPQQPTPLLPPPPNTTTHLDLDTQLSTSTSTTLQGSIFAKFLEVAEARLGGGISRTLLDAYTIDRLETVYFTTHPTDEDAAQRVKEPKVSAVVNSGIFGKKDVYMITGLKVARGLKVETGRAKGWNANAGVGVPLAAAAGLEVGLEVERAREKSVESAYSAAQDVVFAYQLHVVKHKGFRGKYVNVGVYKPEGAVLDDDEEGVAGRDMVQVAVAGEDEVWGFDEEMPVTVIPAKDGEDDCVCIVFDEE